MKDEEGEERKKDTYTRVLELIVDGGRTRRVKEVRKVFVLTSMLMMKRSKRLKMAIYS